MTRESAVDQTGGGKNDAAGAKRKEKIAQARGAVSDGESVLR